MAKRTVKAKAKAKVNIEGLGWQFMGSLLAVGAILPVQNPCLLQFLLLRPLRPRLFLVLLILVVLSPLLVLSVLKVSISSSRLSRTKY